MVGLQLACSLRNLHVQISCWSASLTWDDEDIFADAHSLVIRIHRFQSGLLREPHQKNDVIILPGRAGVDIVEAPTWRLMRLLEGANWYKAEMHVDKHFKAPP
jgi:hypothetical protein